MDGGVTGLRAAVHGFARVRRAEFQKRVSGAMKDRFRWIGVVSRVVAAAFGGYVLSSVAAISLALALPMARSEAVLTGSMVSFVVYVCAVLWVFAASSAWRAWLGLGIPAAVLWANVLLFQPAGLS
jgi:hypothetical protein